MTIAISIKVNDGVALASDSASTLTTQSGVVNVYNNADKILNLHKLLPIGAVTWGMGGLGPSSTTTLMKDLRSRFMGKDNNDPWKIDPNNYKLEDIANRTLEFFTEKYDGCFTKNRPALGFMIVGYSSGEALAEEYVLQIENKSIQLIRQKEETGAYWAGQPEAIFRLLRGYSMNLPTVFEKNLGIKPEQIPAVMEVVNQQLGSALVSPAMPIQDALDLADFLVAVTINYVRFSPGAPTVGGPIELAAITKHEGFKWVKRKHYYPRALNPEKGIS